jgi:hypothetical protein
MLTHRDPLHHDDPAKLLDFESKLDRSPELSDELLRDGQRRAEAFFDTRPLPRLGRRATRDAR